jgi:hypothetical protein
LVAIKHLLKVNLYNLSSLNFVFFAEYIIHNKRNIIAAQIADFLKNSTPFDHLTFEELAEIAEQCGKI